MAAGDVIGNAAAAAFVGISESAWRAYVAREEAPAPYRREVSGGHALPVWKQRVLQAWLDGRPGSGRWGPRHGSG